jgi:hypothetical protein
MTDLTEDQHKKLGELLSSSITNKEAAHTLDLERAAVLLFNLIKSGYYLDDVELDLIIETSGEKYNDSIKEFLQDTIDVCTVLVPGLEEFQNRYNFQDF